MDPLSAVQMGWVESPAYFCAVTETARDITQHLINTNASLPAHPIEISMTIPTVPLRARTDEPNSSIQEVYMDDFVNAATQSMDKMYVPKIRRASIHGIHAILPETATTKHAKNGKEPISESKLKKGDGNFDTTKEVIGFKFCGFKRTVCLPTAKAKRFIKETHTMLRRKRVPSKAAPDSGRKAQACSSHPACNPRLLHHTQQHYEYKQALDYTQHRCKISAPRHLHPHPPTRQTPHTRQRTHPRPPVSRGLPRCGSQRSGWSMVLTDRRDATSGVENGIPTGHRILQERSGHRPT